MAFDKFWESFDHRSAASIIDWSSATVTEKCDGSLTKVFSYRGQWRIASNGCISADKAKIPGSSPPTSVGKLFRQAAAHSFPGGFDELCTHLNPCHTYSFELCHIRNRVVVYHSKPRLIHLNTRVQSTGEVRRNFCT